MIEKKEKKITRPREKKFFKVSAEWIYETLQALRHSADEDVKSFEANNSLIHAVTKWAQNEMEDKEFCSCVFKSSWILLALGKALEDQKEVAEFIEDDLKYEKEYAKNNPEEGEDLPF